MFSKRILVACAAGALACFALTLLAPVQAGGDKKKTEKKAQNKKTQGVWADPNDPSLPADFKFQGEYYGQIPGGAKMGCQVIALGGGAFQAVVLPGGLPGLGWDGKNKTLMAGKLEGDRVVFANISPKEKRRYLAKSPSEFSATSTFPPVGQTDETANLSGETLRLGKGDFEMRKLIRKSSTLGKKPPANAIVLFDGKSKAEWNGGRIDKTTGYLNTDGSDITTKRKFSNYTVHVEFMLPFRPAARGQGRGNSGFYQVDHYEVQILDSFGLDGRDNECGGIYSRIAPKVNACLPPLQWQTYDIDFTNAVRENDKVAKKSRITARLNGILIHDNVEIPGVTGGARSEPEGTPGVLRLQGHGNPLQFRNIWIVEKN